MKAALSAALILTLSQGISISSAQADSPWLTEQEVRTIICRPEYKWDCETMVWTSYRESRWNSEAINYDCYPGHFTEGRPYRCYGLLQLLENPIFDPTLHTRQAYSLWYYSKSDPWGN